MSRGGEWFYHYSHDREQVWEKEYQRSSYNLHECCVQQLNACLQEAARADGAEAGAGPAPAGAASERCLQRFAPEYQQKAAAQAKAAAPQQGEAALPSGFAVIAAWPDDPGSSALALFGAAALVAGLIGGRVGRQRRWARFGAGLLSAFLALLVFLGIVALLPDARPLYLLLALLGAVLAVALRLLLRSRLLLRQRDQDAPVP